MERVRDVELHDGRSSMGAAVARMADAGQRLVSDRLELLRLELREQGSSLARGTAVLVTGLVAGLLGWSMLLACAVLALAPLVSAALIVGILGAAHVAVGALLLWMGARRVQMGGAAARWSPPPGPGPRTAERTRPAAAPPRPGEPPPETGPRAPRLHPHEHIEGREAR